MLIVLCVDYRTFDIYKILIGHDGYNQLRRVYIVCESRRVLFFLYYRVSIGKRCVSKNCKLI